ncbi:hypothetical protein B566_EDAN017174, partial [Ephemera danica]
TEYEFVVRNARAADEPYEDVVHVLDPQKPQPIFRPITSSCRIILLFSQLTSVRARNGSDILLSSDTNVVSSDTIDKLYDDKRSCDPGLHFNRVKQVCDKPANAGCATPPPVPTTQPPPPSSPRCQNVVCPAQNNGYYAIPVPNPGSCTSYCQCDWGVAYYFDCPTGLHFSRFGCATPPPVPTTQPPPPPSPRCQNVVCPAQNNGNYAIPVPNPGSCTSYCQCDWGVAYYFDCPTGLHFSRFG